MRRRKSLLRRQPMKGRKIHAFSPFAFITGLVAYFSVGTLGQILQPIGFLGGKWE